MKRSSRLATVVLPAPVAPTSATVWPCGMVSEKPSNAGPLAVGTAVEPSAAGAGYANLTSSKRISNAVERRRLPVR